MGDFSDDDLDGLDEDDFLLLDDVDSAVPTQILTSTQTSLPVHSHTNSHGPRIDGRQVGSIKPYGNGSISTESRVPHNIARTDHPPYQSNVPSHYEPGPATQREQWRQSRYASTTPGLQRAATVGNISLPHRDAVIKQAPGINSNESDSKSGNNDASSTELARLRAEVEAMRAEQDKFKIAAKQANDQMLAKSGEISILRSNQAKAQQEFERRLEDLQKKNMLDSERHQADLHESRRERERLVSYNEFMVHERNDENWQLKQGGKVTSDKENARPERHTPKKHKPSQFGDGFDDDEVMIISPSKAASKSKNTTPRGGVKRKRDALAENPLKQLDMSPGYLPQTDVYIPPVMPTEQASTSIKHENGVKFLQQLLNRRLNRNEQRTYEVLAACTLPSDPQRSLSTILTSEMASLSPGQSSTGLPTSIGQIVLSLWSKCLDERYHKPIRYLIDLTEFTLTEGSQDVVTNLVEEVVDLAQRTADVNVIPRYKRFKRKTATDDHDSRPLDSDIDTRQCLELLDLTITLCHRDADITKRFWKFMRFDFISMLLRNSQQVEDVTLMVKILSRSVRVDTFAMIVAPPASQSVSEQHVVDRLSAMMIEVPRCLEGERQPDALEISNMRIEILNLIESMTLKTYCGEAFAKHPAALGRLVRVMHDELNALYEYRHGHEKRALLVNQSTRLIYSISRDYEAAIGNLQEKLRAPPTSVYKYLIALSRLAFSEGVVFEQDIDEDVLEMAHEMLELFTSPDEADAIQKAFVKETGRSSAFPQTSG